MNTSTEINLDKKGNLISFLKSLNLCYVEIENQDSLGKIHDLFLKNSLFEPKTDVEMFYFGVYYGLIEKNHSLMKKYYLMAIDLGNVACDE